MEEIYAVEQVSGGNQLLSLFVGAFFIVIFCIPVLMTVAEWFAFNKAGKPGWATLVPFYRRAVFFQVAGKPWWWLFLMVLPVANIVFHVLGCIGFAKGFGRSGSFAVGLIFLPMVFFPIIGFSKKIQYIGTADQN